MKKPINSSGPSFAVVKYNVSSGITTAGVPLGLHGSDTVMLKSTGTPVDGLAVFTSVHEGAAYYFASEESQQTFDANPEQYLPQYGGFCAYAVALRRKFDGNPKHADIVDGKLFLFVNAEIFEEYKKDKVNILAKAEKLWPSIEHVAVGDL